MSRASSLPVVGEPHHRALSRAGEGRIARGKSRLIKRGVHRQEAVARLTGQRLAELAGGSVGFEDDFVRGVFIIFLVDQLSGRQVAPPDANPASVIKVGLPA